jgi:hypothetical protein
VDDREAGEARAWSSSLTSAYETDPLAALERFVDARDKPHTYRGPVYFLHHTQYEKAIRGEPFNYLGFLCRLEHGIPTPIVSDTTGQSARAPQPPPT